MDDWEMWEMPDEVRLSPGERLALVQIESRLRQDRRFARRMGCPRGAGWLPAAVVLLTAVSVFLAVMGIRTSDPALLWCFAVLWPLTLLQAFRLLCRATRARTRSGARVTPWL
ncbi:DUF3040 domain-containing protein [Streptomyces sp. NPDC029006]|uniref:DUF3040 domain-containing protein n=1 Tax=Streptomyces sp. NPDC029006 TaxID=3155467 RepID=UPI0033F103AE